MLTSITPLGERGRGSRWATTVAAFALGAMASGAALGAAVGLIGAATPIGSLSTAARIGVLAAALAFGVALDLGIAGLRLPTPRRQVNEDWLHAYRGWVYGVGFGAELGLGVVTVVTTSAVYLTFVACLLSASPLIGAAVGGTFGLARAASLMPARAVTTPSELFALGAALRRWEPALERIGIAAQATLGLIALAALFAGTAL